ncbi:PREDICTED: uncharacterized protein LOC105144511 [Acromyrmex echinatior]|uniref:uncharacterized protein LOC105144511 n=1 Tax=Acromyrmex echinatior TaxID=103372 RepID=UPI000580EE08|nr:PREDICTED: uncharacterized protein LOC105144511 [Acromyrmex echinatior]XP_011051752.1 PREDICTED: uncharacterized protein LOC105144511 [Acromyrmex echinatior]
MAEQKATFRKHHQCRTNCQNQFPVRQWIRRHYTKMPNSIYAKCHHCPKFITSRFPTFLRDHLVRKHSKELSEEEKEDERTHWISDHFIEIKDTQFAKCNVCNIIIMDDKKNNLQEHLKRKHGILVPCSDCSDVTDCVSSDANTDTTVKEDEIHSASSSKICKNTEQIGVLDKSVSSTESTDDVSGFSPHKDVTKH